MRAFAVVKNLSHDNADYAPGDVVELSDEHAEPLLAAGVVEESDSDGKPVAPKPKGKGKPKPAA